MNADNSYSQPNWWNDSHESAWERVKEALRRDWEQTKSDLGAKGASLNQSVSDTVKQALGKEPVPPPTVPNPPSTTERWEDVEPAVRYGYSARRQYENAEWDDSVEQKLREEWSSIHPQRDWLEARPFVHRGFMGP